MITDSVRNRLACPNATERIDPIRESIGVLSVHLKRYEFAVDYCRGKKVLDAACGAGYGSARLVRDAASVTGIDIDPEAIAYGRRHYGLARLEFQVGDVTQTSFAESDFDVICSFETIEHLDDIPAYLREMIRILNPCGTYIVSTPRRSRTTHRPSNPYHTIEFSRADFESLLQRHFYQVKIYGQRRRQSEIHYWITQLLTYTGLRERLPKFRALRESVNNTLQTTPFNNMSLDDILITEDKIERSSEMVAVCSRPQKTQM